MPSPTPPYRAFPVLALRFWFSCCDSRHNTSASPHHEERPLAVHSTKADTLFPILLDSPLLAQYRASAIAVNSSLEPQARCPSHPAVSIVLRRSANDSMKASFGDCAAAPLDSAGVHFPIPAFRIETPFFSPKHRISIAVFCARSLGFFLQVHAAFSRQHQEQRSRSYSFHSLLT